MPKYGLCDNCQEPSILGHMDCENLDLCPECACELFRFPKERATEVRKNLLEQYEREKQNVNKA